MPLYSKKEIKNLLKKHNLSPIHKMGQNFLINENALNFLLNSANLTKEDTILEIGTGLGALTKEIAKQVDKVVAVEKDRRLIPLLEEELSRFDNIEIINEDIRDISFDKENYKIVSNLPFYLTGVITKDFLEKENKPNLISVIMQKELIKRICANPPNMSLLSVSVQFYAEPEKIEFISKNCFWPPPKVNAGIVKIVPKKLDSPLSNKSFQDAFFKIVKAGFRHKRKKLINNLAQGLDFKKMEIKSLFKKCNLKNKQRAETLSVEDWINLTKEFK